MLLRLGSLYLQDDEHEQAKQTFLRFVFFSFACIDSILCVCIYQSMRQATEPCDMAGCWGGVLSHG